MSILIMGMEMPKSCFYCPCYHHKIDDGYYDYEICRASGTIFNDGYSSVTGHKDHIDPFKARLDNCPLVPVPPHHGRLIDADANLAVMMRVLNAPYTDHGTIDTAMLKACIKMFEEAPTIIEEEEDE